MEKDLRNYVGIYKGILDQNTCRKTVLELEHVNWQEHKFYQSGTGEYFSNKKELSTSFDQVSTNSSLMQTVWHALQIYVNDLNFPWFDSWNGFNAIKFNRYTVNTQMSEHCDHIRDMFDGDRKGIPILTVVGLLNDEFEGGEFVLFQDEIINIKGGDLIIFPSLFLYPHRVNELTSGNRYSFATWVY